MADNKSNAPADKGEGVKVDASAPEGWHPIRPLADQDWAAVNKQYRDLSNDEKPDPSTVAQVEVK